MNKCPNCGADNELDAKFCSVCGALMPSSEPLAFDLGDDAPEPAAMSEEEFGEELFDVWQLYETGDLDGALAKGAAILKANPDSTSAHSIVALIYERKADAELALGNADTAQDFLKLALAEYERIIDLNPDSAADREKLSAVRLRLATPDQKGRAKRPTASAPAAPRGASSNKIPLLIGGSAFVILVVVLAILLPMKKEGVIDSEAAPTDMAAMPTDVAAAPPGSQEIAASPETEPSSDLAGDEESALSGDSSQNVPTPTPSPTPQPVAVPRPTVVAPVVVSAVPAGTATVRPTAPPAPRPAPPANAPKPPAPPPPAPRVAPKPVPKPASVSQPAPRSVEADSAFANALREQDKGNYQGAIAEAQKAVNLYKKDIGAGVNVDSAKRGASTAQRYIDLWKQQSNN